MDSLPSLTGYVKDGNPLTVVAGWKTEKTLTVEVWNWTRDEDDVGKEEEKDVEEEELSWSGTVP